MTKTALNIIQEIIFLLLRTAPQHTQKIVFQVKRDIKQHRQKTFAPVTNIRLALETIHPIFSSILILIE